MSSMFPFWAAIVANIIAQILKPIFLYIRTKKFDPYQAVACGGFPSSHTSTVIALSCSVGLVEGFQSTLFAVTSIFSFIVLYDAVNVRYYAGKNIQLTKQLISDLEELTKLRFSDPIYFEKMKQVLGHRYVEALGGFVLGLFVSIVMHSMLF
ncbi:MAG: divergent PAP2 family protein [Erysipelotrichaceae bacterium]